MDISSSTERKDCFARPVLNLDRALARSGSRNAKTQSRPMTFREFLKANGTSPNPQFRNRVSNISSPIDNLSSAGPTFTQSIARPPGITEACVRPNRFLSLSREREPRLLSNQQDQLRLNQRTNSGPKINLITPNLSLLNKRPDFQNYRSIFNASTTDTEALENLRLPPETQLLPNLKPAYNIEVYLRFLAKQPQAYDGVYTILSDIFYGMPKGEF